MLYVPLMRDRVAKIPNPTTRTFPSLAGTPSVIDQHRILVDHPNGREAEFRQEPLALAPRHHHPARIARLRDVPPIPGASQTPDSGSTTWFAITGVAHGRR